jgi:hypothetical protein
MAAAPPTVIAVIPITVEDVARARRAVLAPKAPIGWACEWQFFPDSVQPKLRGKAAINRKIFPTKEEALREQARLRIAHAGNLNFVSCVTPWVPPPAKQPKSAKPGHRKGGSS